MPLIAWRRRPASRDFAARSAGAEGGVGDLPGSDGSHVANAVSGLFDPRVAAWMTDTGSSDKALEFEALCVSRLKEANTGECYVRSTAVLVGNRNDIRGRMIQPMWLDLLVSATFRHLLKRRAIRFVLFQVHNERNNCGPRQM